jgi:hypothetical protein
MTQPSESWDDPELHRELRELPYPSAPPTLAREVMQSIRRTVPVTSTPSWWRRPIQTWPIAAQCLGCLGLLIIAAAAMSLPLWSQSWVADMTDSTSAPSWLLACISIAQIGIGLLGTVQGVLTSIPSAVWAIGIAGAACLYAMALGLGTWVHRQLGAEQL